MMRVWTMHRDGGAAYIYCRGGRSEGIAFVTVTLGVAERRWVRCSVGYVSRWMTSSAHA